MYAKRWDAESSMLSRRCLVVERQEWNAAKIGTERRKGTKRHETRRPIAIVNEG